MEIFKNKSYALLVAIFIFSIDIAFAQTSDLEDQPTISNHQYIESEIAKLSEATISFDNLRSSFSRVPEYKTSCYASPSTENNAEASKLFKKHLPNYLEGSLGFDFAMFDLGFNIFQKTDLNWVDGQNEFQLSCIANGDGCISLNQSTESKFTHLEPNEDYSPDSLKTETWANYILDLSTIYSELTIGLSTKEFDWIGRESKSVTYQVNYLCVSRLQNYQTEL